VTVLSAAQAAAYWTGAGGPASRAVEWVAIAIGESSLDTAAVSSAGAIGLWQIMPFNAAPYGYAVAQLYDPAVNAAIAVAMSGGGTNCAAWDSCYTDIEADGRLSFLSWPQPGSADYANLAVAAGLLGGKVTAAMAAPSFPGIDASLPGTVAQIDKIAGQSLPGLALRAARARQAIAWMYR
jgi:hypothetical protein